MNIANTAISASMNKKDDAGLGCCPLCGANRDLVGRVHRCRPVSPASKKVIEGAAKKYGAALKRLADRQESPPPKDPERKSAAELQAEIDAPIKQRGRPKKKTDEERREAARLRMAKRRHGDES